MFRPRTFLRAAFDKAICHVDELSGDHPNSPPGLSIVDDHSFWAFARIEQTGQIVDVSTGVAEAVRGLWDAAGQSGYKVDLPTSDLTELTLCWLFCHEIEHFNLGHFAVSGQMALTETGHAERLGLVARGDCRPSPVDYFSPEDRALVEPCLEMQADHGAIELVLGPYSSAGWTDLRWRVACISAAMVLIEREDEKSGVSHKSHPKAATRIFQLLGHLSEMWSLPARLGAASSLPPETEIRAFSSRVILPAFEDALLLARVGGTEGIVQDLGDLVDCFEDVALANSGGWNDPKEFRTTGSQEWARLTEINAEILKALGQTS